MRCSMKTKWNAEHLRSVEVFFASVNLQTSAPHTQMAKPVPEMAGIVTRESNYPKKR